MKKRRRKPNRLAGKVVAVAAVALIVPISVRILRAGGDFLEKTGEKAAVISAAINMPEGGIELIEDRFREDLYYPEEEEHQARPFAEEETSISPPQMEELVPEDPGEEASQAEESSRVEESSQAEEPVEEPSKSAAPPKIPEQYRAALVSENFAAGSDSKHINFGAGYIRNSTDLSDEEVQGILETPFDLGFVDTDEPQVLIIHTHATESFERYDSDVYDTRNTWRSRDNNSNMVAVGSAMADVLEQNGIGVIHDTTQHDYPSYNGSYERSAKTIQDYLDEYPSIKVVLDLHRDAMERENEAIVKPVTTVDGKKAAQIMIIAACDDDGTLGVPNYKSNIRFAAAFQDYMESAYPELTRPVFFCYRKYNQDLSPGGLLLEFGSNANTLEEATYSGQLAGQALADLIIDNME